VIEYFLKAQDGYELCLNIYDVKNPKAVVQIAHGMEEHQGRYEEFANILSKKGFIVVTSDIRGHGLEENNLGVINHCNKGKTYKTEFRTYRIVNGMKLMKELGLAYQTRSNKTLPENIHIFNKHSVCELLAGLFDSDGSINSNIVLYQTHKKILESIKY
jgi:hypothetical protein